MNITYSRYCASGMYWLYNQLWYYYVRLLIWSDEDKKWDTIMKRKYFCDHSRTSVFWTRWDQEVFGWNIQITEHHRKCIIEGVWLSNSSCLHVRQLDLGCLVNWSFFYNIWSLDNWSCNVLWLTLSAQDQEGYNICLSISHSVTQQQKNGSWRWQSPED